MTKGIVVISDDSAAYLEPVQQERRLSTNLKSYSLIIFRSHLCFCIFKLAQVVDSVLMFQNVICVLHKYFWYGHFSLLLVISILSQSGGNFVSTYIFFF